MEEGGGYPSSATSSPVSARVASTSARRISKSSAVATGGRKTWSSPSRTSTESAVRTGLRAEGGGATWIAVRPVPGAAFASRGASLSVLFSSRASVSGGTPASLAFLESSAPASSFDSSRRGSGGSTGSSKGDGTAPGPREPRGSRRPIGLSPGTRKRCPRRKLHRSLVHALSARSRGRTQPASRPSPLSRIRARRRRSSGSSRSASSGSTSTGRLASSWKARQGSS